jgi:hypothetical protein
LITRLFLEDANVVIVIVDMTLMLMLGNNVGNEFDGTRFGIVVKSRVTIIIIIVTIRVPPPSSLPPPPMLLLLLLLLIFGFWSQLDANTRCRGERPAAR